MNHDPSVGDAAELAALYAAGAMTAPERSDFEAHLEAGCPACREEVGQLVAVMAALASAVEPVTPDLQTRAALMSRLRPPPPARVSPLRQHLDREPSARELHQDMIIQRASESAWKDSDLPGIRLRVLHVDPVRNQFTALIRMAPGTSYPRHHHQGPEECLVLEGDLQVSEMVLHPGDYQWAPAGSCHGVQSTQQGCLLLVTSSLTDEFI
jgi:anti-sigma factor ChrR (cupin superfamily)